jgi:AcrR family transcriptional regulator
MKDGMVARIVKDYTVRRDEILDSAQRLVYARGYEQMTIQDILDDLQIAKGTFYYYFGSKEALLEAVIERMIDVVEQLLIPIVHDPGLLALEKFQHFFDVITRLKSEQKPFLLALLRGWYTDGNIIVREKARAAGFQRMRPLLTAIIQQGVQEGVLTTPYPEYASEMFLLIGGGLNENLARMLLNLDTDRDRIQRMIDAYTDAIEQVLGMPAAALQLVTMETMNEWIAALQAQGS